MTNEELLKELYRLRRAGRALVKLRVFNRNGSIVFRDRYVDLRRPKKSTYQNLVNPDFQRFASCFIETMKTPTLKSYIEEMARYDRMWGYTAVLQKGISR